MIWQMMVALLHSNGQLRTERDGDTEKGCHKPVVQQKTTDDDPFSDCDNEFHQSSLLIICARV